MYSRKIVRLQISSPECKLLCICLSHTIFIIQTYRYIQCNHALFFSDRLTSRHSLLDSGNNCLRAKARKRVNFSGLEIFLDKSYRNDIINALLSAQRQRKVREPSTRNFLVFDYQRLSMYSIWSRHSRQKLWRMVTEH